MKLIAFLGFAATFVATSSIACPWDGGTYYGRELNFRIDIQVSSGCAQATIKTSSSAGFQKPGVAETFALEHTNKGWLADVHGAKVILLEDGKHILIDGPSGQLRLFARSG